jgi:DNA-binding winged helix-turn-helix (wHTH) protein
VFASARQKRSARFGPFELDLRAGELRKQNHRVRLQNQPFQILLLLLENAGDVVTREQVQEKLWSSDTVVEFEHSIGTALKKLRQALSDDAAHPRYIETLSRRGYRWLAPVEWREMTVADGWEMGRSGFEVTESVIKSFPPSSVPEKSSQVRLVGRERDIDQLEACLEKVLCGQRQVVFVTGEPGIGKTALVDEFARQAKRKVTGLQIARGQCVEGYGGKEAYYPVLEAAGHLSHEIGNDFVQLLAEQAPTWLVQFPSLLTREHRENLQREILGATRERMLREIGDVLETFTAASPLLLILEDLHWADRSTVDLISALARRRAPSRLMLVCTKRPLDAELSDHPLRTVKQDLQVHQLCDEVPVSPLTEDEVSEYLASDSSEASLPKGLAAMLHRHSGGNPLFMVAAVEHLRERSLISRDKESWKLEVPLEKIELGVPQRLRRMIESQIERLSKEQQRALEVASVSGVVFEASVSAAAAEIDAEEFEDLCEKLSQRNHLVHWAGSRRLADGTVSLQYEFIHAMYREAFYHRQAMGRRVKLHQRIGERLEAIYAGPLREVAATQLAYHFEEGCDWARAVKYLQVAANDAGKRFEPQQAAAILQHALELVMKLPVSERAKSEIEILQRIASIYASAFDPRSLEIFKNLVDRASLYDLPEVEFSALLDMAVPLAVFTGIDAYMRSVDRARDLLGPPAQTDSLKRAVMRARCECYRACASKWAPGESERYWDLVAKVRESGDRRLLAEVEFTLTYSLFNSSRYREAQQYANEASAIMFEGYDDNPYLWPYFNVLELVVSLSHLFSGEWGVALEKMNQRVLMVEKNRDPIGASMARLTRARLLIFSLDFSGAQRVCASTFPAVSNIPVAFRDALIVAGLAEAGLGKPEQALEYLHKSKDEMARMRMMSDWYNHMLLQWGLAEAWLSKGDLEKARIEATEFLNVTLATDEHTFWALAYEANVRLAIAEQDLERAQEFLAKALESMEGYEVPLAHWRVHGTASELHKLLGNRDLVEGHRELSRATIRKLADSLPAEEPLRETFLSAPLVRRILSDNPENSFLRAREV